MIDALNDGFRRFLDFRGRSNKLQYRSFLFFYVLTDLFLGLFAGGQTTLNSVIMAFLLVPLLAVQIRRSHDTGKSGWWVLLPFYSIYLIFAKSVPEEPTDTPQL